MERCVDTVWNICSPWPVVILTRDIRRQFSGVHALRSNHAIEELLHVGIDELNYFGIRHDLRAGAYVNLLARFVLFLHLRIEFVDDRKELVVRERRNNGVPSSVRELFYKSRVVLKALHEFPADGAFECDGNLISREG